jgi:hypothetical protein
MIKTNDDSVHILNIKDIMRVEVLDHFEGIILNTIDKEFYIDMSRKQKYMKVYNEDIFNALKLRKSISTESAYNNYNRMTIIK